MFIMTTNVRQMAPNMTKSNSNIDQIKPQKDQFKATKIWNEVLRAFYLGIELKKYRRNMKTYYDCFKASDAVTWLKNYLSQCEHFNGNNATRFQALNLVRKYHKSSIIERLKPGKNDKEFQDNNELYRFTINANENLPFLTTSKSESDLLESCSSDQTKVELNLNEKIYVYKKIVWQQMIKTFPNLSNFIKFENIDGNSLMNNVTRVNENGVVQMTDKSLNLPHWVMSAMKCLANWPKASGSGNCLPKYPGFEFDVFNLIRDYFTNSEEPLIPFSYYRLIMSIFDLYTDSLTINYKARNAINEKHNISQTSLTNNNNNISRVNMKNEINLPSNCVYETVFSGREPVTKIVPIDELSGVFPNLMNYFNQSLIPTYPYTPIKNSSTFNAISTIPRSSTSSLSTPKNNNIANKFDIIYSLESPPEAGEYMLNKDFGSKFYSLRKNRKRDTAASTCRSDFSAINPRNEYYELLQLALLILPSSNRRNVHLLTRLFYRIIRNKELCLLTKDSLALKEHIINIFTRCILRSEKENDYNELKAKQVVSFLIDECMDIFGVNGDFVKEVDDMITNLKNKKVETSANGFCQKITSDEYEMQRDVMSEVALSELLESIMRDDSLSERDKLKWIKQFKMYHPDVYDIYFASCSARTVTTNNVTTNKTARTQSLGTTLLPKRKFVKRFLSLKF